MVGRESLLGSLEAPGLMGKTHRFVMLEMLQDCSDVIRDK